MNFSCLHLPGLSVPSPQLRESAEFPGHPMLPIPAPQARNPLTTGTGAIKELASFVSCHSEIVSFFA